MHSNDLLKLSPESAPWQDYRSSNAGMVVFYSSDPISEFPIREIPEELHSDIPPEPNYETGTYGLYGCGKSKIRNAFVKAKLRYLFFVTKYEGTKTPFKNKLFITGYYRIFKTADVKRLHIRHGSDYSCLDEQNCFALRAEESKFVTIDDAFPMTDDVLKAWEYDSRITKQTRIILNEQNTVAIVEFLNSKKDILQQYIAETKRLQPHSEDEDAESESAGNNPAGGEA